MSRELACAATGGNPPFFSAAFAATAAAAVVAAAAEKAAAEEPSFSLMLILFSCSARAAAAAAGVVAAETGCSRRKGCMLAAAVVARGEGRGSTRAKQKTRARKEKKWRAKRERQEKKSEKGERSSIWLSTLFLFFLLPVSPLAFFPARARAELLLSLSAVSKRDFRNVRSPARPPRIPGAGGGPSRCRRRSGCCPHRPPRPRGGQEGRGPPHRGTFVLSRPEASAELEIWSIGARAEAHETRESGDKRKIFEVACYKKTPPTCLSLTLAFPLPTRTHSLYKQVQVGDEEAPEMAVKRFRRSAGNANVVMEVRAER